MTVPAPWAGVGKPLHVTVGADYTAIMEQAGLNWRVEGRPVYDGQGMRIPHYQANTRVDTGVVLGIPTEKYRIVQNDELFIMVEGLLGESCTVLRAGASDEGRSVWAIVEAATPHTVGGIPCKLALAVTNAHTGLNSFQVRLLPQLPSGAVFPLKVGRRVVYLRHTLNVANRMDVVRMTLNLGERYMATLDALADELTTPADWGALTQKWLPPTERANARMEFARTLLKHTDVESRLEGTKWGFLVAAAEVVNRLGPARDTTRSAERRLETFLEGPELLDRALAAVK